MITLFKRCYAQVVKKFLNFMEPKRLLLSSQQSTSSCCPKPHKTRPAPFQPIFYDQFHICLPSMTKPSTQSPSFWVSHQILYVFLFSPTHATCVTYLMHRCDYPITRKPYTNAKTEYLNCNRSLFFLHLLNVNTVVFSKNTSK